MHARGYIGLTDPEWHSFLSELPQVDEVNFWQPHGNRSFRALSPGEPFIFKLRAPQKLIAGFGFFQRFEFLPARLAWETFGPMNGAPTFDAMLTRIRRLRGDSGAAGAAGEFQIGCVMLAAPVFFKREDWVAPPSDWAKTGIQQGKTYDVAAGEGQRVLSECLLKAQHQYWNVDRLPAQEGAEETRYGSPITVVPRLGQGLFRFAVQDAYSGACAVTGEHSLPALDAAHIRPYADGGTHRVENGLLLRSDIHRLYDRGYVTVTPDHAFKVSEALRNDYDNGRSYYALDGTRIHLPNVPDQQPNQEALEWHATQLYKG